MIVVVTELSKETEVGSKCIVSFYRQTDVLGKLY